MEALGVAPVANGVPWEYEVKDNKKQRIKRPYLASIDETRVPPAF